MPLSSSRSDRGDLHFYDVATAKPLGEIVPRVNYGTALGSAAWNADGSGIYYTRYPRPGERPENELDFYQEVWFHKLGTPAAEDRYEIGNSVVFANGSFLQPRNWYAFDAGSRKMIARLQAANASNRPILLRTSSSTGHGSGTALSQRVTMNADVWSFVFDQLGMRYERERAPDGGNYSSPMPYRSFRETSVARATQH